MSDYTIKNFDDLDDALAGRDAGVDVRFARKHIDSRQLGVTWMRYAPNARFPFGHTHREQEEAYVVIAGSGRVRLGDEILPVRQWDVVRVAATVTRRFEAGEDGLELIIVGGACPDGGDGVKVEDGWPADE
ncbi:MAG TPA: cupin domain-containing protein [Solirubrobacteraceae bacterium]|nr:cupin domain-containing protein [Solirubrobacteraceae bacterium]